MSRKKFRDLVRDTMAPEAIARAEERAAAMPEDSPRNDAVAAIDRLFGDEPGFAEAAEENRADAGAEQLAYDAVHPPTRWIEGDHSEAICEECGGVQPITFRRRPFTLVVSQVGPVILVGVCDMCDATVSVPHQSVPEIKAARDAAAREKAVKYPAHVQSFASLRDEMIAVARGEREAPPHAAEASVHAADLIARQLTKPE